MLLRESSMEHVRESQSTSAQGRHHAAAVPTGSCESRRPSGAQVCDRPTGHASVCIVRRAPVKPGGDEYGPAGARLCVQASAVHLADEDEPSNAITIQRGLPEVCRVQTIPHNSALHTIYCPLHTQQARLAKWPILETRRQRPTPDATPEHSPMGSHLQETGSPPWMCLRLPCESDKPGQLLR